MASRAEVEAVTMCPAASRMAHFKVTTCGSSSTQRILAIAMSFNAGAPLSARIREIWGCQTSRALAGLFSGSHYVEVKSFTSGTFMPSTLSHRSGIPDFLSYGLGLGEQQQVVRAPGLGIGSRHIEPPEGVSPHHGSRALAVEIKVAHVELRSRTFELFPRCGIDRAGKPKFRVVGDLQRLLVVSRLDHSQHRPEDLFLGDARRRRDVGNHRGLDV